MIVTVFGVDQKSLNTTSIVAPQVLAALRESNATIVQVTSEIAAKNLEFVVFIFFAAAPFGADPYRFLVVNVSYGK